MDDLWLKALHIAAVATWVGGMLAAALVMTARVASRSPGSGDSAILQAVYRWDRRVTSPAMMLVWALGLTLALHGGWFAAPWLTIKLGFVVALSALHGLLSGTLRRLAGTQTTAPAFLRHAPAAILAGVLAIVVLVVVKPF